MNTFKPFDASMVFSSTVPQVYQLEQMANQALSNGIAKFQKKDYEGAVREFRRSIAISPNSQFSSDAANYMASAHIQLNDMDSAVRAYQLSIRINPNREDTRISLGNLFFTQERYQEAEQQYTAAIRINPTATNYYSLGQVYLKMGNYHQAETQFWKVVQLEPDEPAGSYGLGLTYSKEGRFDDAIRQFNTAIEAQRDFYDAYLEMGFAYADSGRMPDALSTLDLITERAPELADLLSRYLYKADPPKLAFVHSTSTFDYTLPRMTAVSALDAYLADANAAQAFTMKFQFDKEMDGASVVNRFNWTIGRAPAGRPGGMYNFGLPLAPTEVAIPPYPDYVFYDPKQLTATLVFTIRQNSTASGTIDPAHIEFRFSGKDIFGLAMDPDKDQFTGFSGVA
jgi:tetratricopeptide (TPR) repeat protein